jgi:parvulin-like peptidyl-prolyl isomerase
MKRRLMFIYLFFFFIVVLVLTPAAQGRAEDKIIAVANNEIITRRDLEDFTNFMNMQLSSEYEGEELKNKVNEIKPELLNKLIEDRLILQQARKENLIVEPARIKARVAQMQSRYPSETIFLNALSDQGLTLRDIERRIEEQLLILDMIEAKVKNKIVINPREVTEFYQLHAGELVMPESRSVDALAIKEENQIEKIKELIAQGMDFDKISTVYNTEINKLGVVSRGQLKKEIEDAVFNLDAAAVSQPLELNGQYFIFRVERVMPERNYTLAEAQEAIYSRLYELKIKERLVQWLSELKEKSYVDIK